MQVFRNWKWPKVTAKPGNGQEIWPFPVLCWLCRPMLQTTRITYAISAEEMPVAP